MSGGKCPGGNVRGGTGGGCPEGKSPVTGPHIRRYLKVHNVFPKVNFPPWLRPVTKMASKSERIMEKSRNFQIVYVGRTNLCKHCTTDQARGIMKYLAIVLQIKDCCFRGSSGGGGRVVMVVSVGCI